MESRSKPRLVEGQWLEDRGMAWPAWAALRTRMSGRVGRDAEHHHDAGAGGAARHGEVHQLQRAGAGLHPGRGWRAQQRALHPDQGGW